MCRPGPGGRRVAVAPACRLHRCARSAVRRHSFRPGAGRATVIRLECSADACLCGLFRECLLTSPGIRAGGGMPSLRPAARGQGSRGRSAADGEYAGSADSNPGPAVRCHQFASKNSPARHWHGASARPLAFGVRPGRSAVGTPGTKKLKGLNRYALRLGCREVGVLRKNTSAGNVQF